MMVCQVSNQQAPGPFPSVKKTHRACTKQADQRDSMSSTSRMKQNEATKYNAPQSTATQSLLVEVQDHVGATDTYDSGKTFR